MKMAESTQESGKLPTLKVIREIYDDKKAEEKFQIELERALEKAMDIIVIEPTRLGDETARWIAVGSCLHRTAYLSGLGALGSCFIWSDRPYVSTPLCVISLLCTGVYTLAWQFDPCVYYKVQNIKKINSTYPTLNLTSSSNVVLVRRDVTRRNLLHTGVSLLATVVCMWRIFDSLK